MPSGMSQFYQKNKVGLFVGLLGATAAGFYFYVRPELKNRKMKKYENEMDSLMKKGKKTAEDVKDSAAEKTKEVGSKLKDLAEQGKSE